MYIHCFILFLHKFHHNLNSGYNFFFAVLHDDPHPDPQTSLDNMVLSPSGPYIPGEGDYQYGQSDRMVTSTINDKKKKGAGVPGKSIEEELCRICGDRASGYHYNALSCEGCKGG